MIDCIVLRLFRSLSSMRQPTTGVAMSASGSAVLSPADPSKQLAKNTFLGLGFLYAALVIMAGHPATSTDQVLPFTAHEVWWSIRDGYAFDLMSHYLRHGGLSIGESSTQ